MTWTFEELAALEMGTILEQGVEEGVPWFIMRGPASLTAYLGIPLDHPFAKMTYDDVDLDVHGGLTFGSVGDGDLLSKDHYWLGWDYAHWNDVSFYYLKYPDLKMSENGTKWTVDLVRPEVIRAARDLALKMIEYRSQPEG